MSTKLLQVKPFQETLHGGYCGPASLKMVMDYFGKDVSEEEVAEKCGRDSELGTDGLSIKNATEEYGFNVEIQNNSSFDDIAKWLDRGVPIIVNWFTRGRSDYDDSQVPDGHYSVVVGLDDESIYIQDPEIGDGRIINRDDFYRVWFDFKGNVINEWDDIILRQIIAVFPRDFLS
jgi:ABC-type bacteriocin/lantibiotic exporter with double-glycine peptidase domain